MIDDSTTGRPRVVATDRSATDRQEAACRHADELTALYRHAPVGLGVLDRNLRFIRINEVLAKINGYSVEEHIGRFAWDIVPGLREAAEPSLRRVFDSGEAIAGIELAGETAKQPGARRHWIAQFYPIKDPDGSVVGVGVICEEVSTGKVATAALAGSEARYQAIVETAVAAIIVIDELGLIQSFNPAAERIFGYASAEVLGRNVTLLMSEKHARAHDAYLAAYRRTGVRKIVGIGREVVGRRRDGAIFPLDIAVAEWRDAEGKRFFTGMIHDITERKQAEAQLRSFIDQAPAAIAMFDRSMRYLAASRRWIEDYGLDADTLLGRSHYEVFPEIPNSWRQAHRRALAGETIRATEDRFERVGAPPVWLSWEARPWFSAKGAIEGVLLFTENVTARKRAEEALLQSQKMEAIGQLTGGVAHDFNNLLTVVLGNLEMLEERLTSEHDRLLLREAREAARSGADLTGRLLAFARRHPLDPRPVDLARQLAELATLLRRTLGETIEVRTKLPHDLPQALVDPGQLQNAILNLALNARDAMPGGGTLVLEAGTVAVDERRTPAQTSRCEPGRYAVLSVTDTGIGMAPEVRERAFEPFFTTKEPGTGTGLGLAMVYGFAKQSRRARPDLQRARPRHDDPALPAAGASRAGPIARAVPPPRRPVGAARWCWWWRTIRRVRRYAVAKLGSLGYRVVEAADGPAALDLHPQRTHRSTCCSQTW